MTTRLFNQRLFSEANLPLSLTSIVFYNSIAFKNLLFSIWTVLYAGLEERYSFSVYEQGKIVLPSEDARFKKPYEKQFGTTPWINCEFESLDEIIQFILACTL